MSLECTIFKYNTNHDLKQFFDRIFLGFDVQRCSLFETKQRRSAQQRIVQRRG